MQASSSLSWREAISNGDTLAVRQWLERGVDANLPIEGALFTPLMMAAAAGVPGEITRLLIEKGARLDTAYTPNPLVVCAHTGNEEAARALLAEGWSADFMDEDKQFVLDTAVESQNVDVARALLDHGAQIDRADKNGGTALMRAVRTGNPVLVDMLLERGANPNCQDKRGTAFALSIATSVPPTPANEHIVLSLLSKTRRDLKNDLGSNALLLCVAGQYPSAVKQLLDEGEDPNARNDRNVSALNLAAGRDDKDILQMVLDAGGDVHSMSMKGFTPLLVACSNGLLDNATLLIKANSNVNFMCPFGDTPLSMATETGNMPLLLYLVEQGGRLHASFNGATLLHHAAIGGDERIAQWLIQQGLRDLTPNDKGDYALHMAARTGNAKVAIVLIEAGSNPARLNADGVDLFQIGSSEFNAELGALLAESHAQHLKQHTPTISGGKGVRRF